MNNLRRLLDEALSLTSFTLSQGEKRYSADDIRAMHRQGTLQQFFGITTTIPEPLKKRLVDEIGHMLRSYVNPETQCVGNGLINILAGVIDPPLVMFTENVVYASAALGAERVVQLLSQWSNGKRVSYQRRVVLFGGQVEQAIELPEDGIRIDRLPTSTDQLLSVIPRSLQYVVPWMGSNSVLGRSVLSIACSLDPVFYMPTGETSREFHREWANGRLPEFSFKSFCEVLSLAGNGCIQPNHEWSHAPDLALFTSVGSSLMSRSDVLESRSSVPLSQHNLEDARELFLMRYNLSNSSQKSLNVSIHRWIKSKGEMSTQDQLIELRIALEALYLKGEGGELSFRMATRGAWHLGGNKDERARNYKILRDVYELASKVVHTSRIKDTDEQQRKKLERGQNACREGILKDTKRG